MQICNIFTVCNSKYFRSLRSQICWFPKDEFINVPTWGEKSKNQKRLMEKVWRLLSQVWLQYFQKTQIQSSLLSNINDDSDNKEKIKCLKTWVRMFRVGIYRTGIIWGEFTRGEFDRWEFSALSFCLLLSWTLPFCLLLSWKL